jgi:hypothetical protein
MRTANMAALYINISLIERKRERKRRRKEKEREIERCR